MEKAEIELETVLTEKVREGTGMKYTYSIDFGPVIESMRAGGQSFEFVSVVRLPGSILHLWIATGRYGGREYEAVGGDKWEAMRNVVEHFWGSRASG